ncbi:MAG: Nif3-like dinuclear metal center hexameric protein [Candidatus Riflebacteria bacterium]|nr:Nif3-like dinuclear metal center hexameric protein [Candidatus Riflebacteria bacterium]
MIKRQDLVKYLDELFNVPTTPDVSYNGLQFEGAERVRTVVTGVDATGEFFRQAAAAGGQFAIVHHGLFWKGREWRRIDRFARATVTALAAADLSLYALHLPLDGHPELGNNARLAQAIGARLGAPFGDFLGQKVGYVGRFPRPLTVAAFRQRCEKAIGPLLVHLDHGPARISAVGIVSGGGWDTVTDQLVESGELQAVLTGEAIHQAVALCRDRRVHLFAFGHYATETFGVKALGDHLAAKFGLVHRFIDVPTGL